MRAKSFLPSLRAKAGVLENPFLGLHDEIDRVFDEFAPTALRRFGGSGNGGLLNLQMDVSETEKAIEISAELPGVEEKDVDVSVSDHLLTIRGEKRAETETDEADRRIVERSYGSFVRSMNLPFAVDAAKVEARFDKGVLKLTVPKPPEVMSKSHKIKIKPSA